MSSSYYVFDDELAPPEPVRAPTVDEATALIEAARAEAEAVRAAAFAQGLEEGRAAGRAEALEGLTEAVAALGDATAALHAERARDADALEAAAVELALAIAERVVAGALEARPERVLDVVRGALRSVVERSQVLLLVNPDDLEMVSRAVAELESSLGGIGRLEVQAERRVGRGGALVRTPDGEVDATIATKLERAREALAP
jgi:flagellar biosynthesis/type III secretory pathway protein FliH